MEQNGPSGASPRPHSATSSRVTWALIAVLVVVAAIAAFRLVAGGRHDSPDRLLRGNSDEATGALEDVIARTPSAERLPMLLRYADDSSPGLRYAAVDALGQLRGPDVADAVESAFTDSSSVVRQRALEVLPTVDRERGLRLLLTGLRDHDTWIREAAASQFMVLARLRRPVVDRRAVPMLVRALDDPNKTVRVFAMGALRTLTGKPWRARVTGPPNEEKAAIAKWRQWWAAREAKWRVPSTHADPKPVQPARTDPAPDIDVADIDRRRFTLTGQKGRLTMLNFWAHWCAPCLEEIPGLARLDREYRARGLDIVGMALSDRDGGQTVRDWCRTNGVQYRQVLANDAITDAYGHIEQVPITVLIDGAGRVRYRWEGERDYATFRAGIERVLSEGQ